MNFVLCTKDNQKIAITEGEPGQSLNEVRLDLTEPGDQRHMVVALTKMELAVLVNVLGAASHR
jgi:hypothetical protein